MKKVIINADDFGYSPAVNQGILKAFKDGILTSTTLMGNMPGFEDAIEIAKENSELGVGIHLVLTCGSPLTDGKSFCKNGNFYKLKEYHKNRGKIDDKEIFIEWSYQIDKILSTGINITHIDSHHHLHTFSENLKITEELSKKYKLPFRNAFGLEDNINLNNQIGVKGFLDLFNHENIRDIKTTTEAKKAKILEEIQTVLDKIQDGNITELMVHPAYVDEILYFNSSFNIARIKEVSLLCDEDVKQLFKDNKIELYNYGNIK